MCLWRLLEKSSRIVDRQCFEYPLGSCHTPYVRVRERQGLLKSGRAYIRVREWQGLCKSTGVAGLM